MNEEKVQKEEESKEELVISRLSIGTREQEVEGIIALDPPEDNIYYWSIEYKDGTQIFTSEKVTVVYSKQVQNGEVVNITKGLVVVK